VSAAKADAVEQAADVLCRGKTWLGCEPVNFSNDDGSLSGGSKPNFMPDPHDAAAAVREGLPNGTTRDLLDILCRLSREHGIDWEVRDDSGGPAAYIRNGVADRRLAGQLEAIADLCDENLENLMAESGDRPKENEDDEPPILPFRPRGG